MLQSRRPWCWQLMAWLSCTSVVNVFFLCWWKPRHSKSLSGCVPPSPAAWTGFWFRLEILKGVVLSPAPGEPCVGHSVTGVSPFQKEGAWSLQGGPGLQLSRWQADPVWAQQWCLLLNYCLVASTILNSYDVPFGFRLLCHFIGWPSSAGAALGCPSWGTTSANWWPHRGRTGELCLQT